MPDLSPPADFAVVDQVPPPDLSFPRRDARVHPDPTVIQLHGGRVLHNIDVVTVQWEGDDLGPERQDFAAWMVNSEYWDTLIEYKVARGTARGPYAIKAPFPAVVDDSSVGPLLRARIADGTLPVATVNTLYMIYLPQGTVSTAGRDRGCQSYGGYHFWTPSGTTVPKLLPYAIIPACYPGPDRFDADTVTMSHEIAEAATDPDGGGWYGDGPLTEVTDLCNPLSHDYENVTVGDGGVPHTYTVARSWSAKAAAEGTSDPCVPVPPLPYEWFNAGLEPTNVVLNLDQSGQGKVTFQVHPFSYGSSSKVISWDIRQGPFGGVSFSTVHGTGLPGSTQEVVVRANGSDYGTFPIFLESRTGTYKNVWYGTLTIQ